MYPSHSYINEKAYCVRPCVVKDGCVSKIRIFPADESIVFSNADIYEVRLLPKDFCENYGESRFSQLGAEEMAEVMEVRPCGGEISFEYRFYGFQEWIVYLRKKNDSEVEWYWTDSFPKTRARLSLFCLTEEYYGCVPLKGDLHIHTTLSDGNQSPEYNAAAYREAGFDFLAITDHGKYCDGKSLSEYFSFADPLIVLPGEEIHEKANAVIHTVCIGADRPISQMLQNDEDMLSRLLEKAKKKYEVPKGCYEREYLLRAVIYEQIKESGGIAILAHPFWQLPERFNADTRISAAVLENGLVDAMEVFGGCTPEGNDLQATLFYSLRNRELPIVASSDSHTVLEGITAFGEIFTLAFSKDRNIIKSIIDRKSVAVYKPIGMDARLVGEMPLVKFSHFLLRIYYPRHDTLCRISGELMKRYVEGDPSVKEAICVAERRIKSFERDFFGL